MVLVSCPGYEVLDQVVLGNPQLGTAAELLNLPPEAEVCPNNNQDGRAP